MIHSEELLSVEQLKSADSASSQRALFYRAVQLQRAPKTVGDR